MEGDLQEEFERRAHSSRGGARWWYWREATSVAVRYGLPERWTGRGTNAGRSGTGGGLDVMLDSLLFNVRYAVRRMWRTPFFTATAILSLGLGIGANTAIFSLVNAVILRETPFENPEQLVDLYSAEPGFTHGTLSYPDYLDAIEATQGVFSDISTMRLSFVQTEDEGEVQLLTGEAISGNYFEVLGIRPAIGRLIQRSDDVSPGAHPVVVLGHAYWMQRYLGDPGVVGSTLRLAGRPYTILGVTPPAYQGGIRGLIPQVYYPMAQADQLSGTSSNSLEARGQQSQFSRGRLLPGATVERAEAALEVLAADLRRDFPNNWDNSKAFALVATESVIMNPMVDRVLLPAAGVLMVVVGLVLLIACANLASFLLARAADRRKEIAVRLAMGARRRTLIGQLLTETMLLSLLGGAAGLGIAVLALSGLQGADLPLPIPISIDLSLDGTVLGFGLLISLGAGLAFGLAPALQSTNPDVAPTLRDESAGGGRARGNALRSLLVIGQVATSVVLLIGAGLFLRSFQASSQIHPGFGDAPTAIVQVVTPADRYDAEAQHAFWVDLKSRVARMEGVQGVGLMDNILLNQLNTQYLSVRVAGVEPENGAPDHSIDYAVADATLLDAAGMELLAGRTFQASDTDESEAVAIVSEAFAQKFYGTTDVIGRTFQRTESEATIVGLIRDVKVRSLGEAPRPYVLIPYSQTNSSFMTILARSAQPDDALPAAIVRAAQEIDPQIMIVDAKTMDRHLGALRIGRAMGAQVIGGFALLALLLASIGLYGVVSYAVSRRAREVGIRLSLGADSSAVVWMLTRGGLRLVAVGGVVGLLMAGLMAQGLSRLIYGVPALDPVTFIGTPVLLGLVALAASWIPARRATLVSPASALRRD